MKENKYDDSVFFEQYSHMPRSEQGLSAAGEWPALKALLPELAGKRVLDLGCGFGWHCRYAAEHGAARVLGTDLSQRMLERARAMTDSPVVEYRRAAIEDMRPAPAAWDVVLSSLALHYVEDYAGVCRMVWDALSPGGWFIFSAEHPVFTAQGPQDWQRDAGGAPLHWPVDRYFEQGPRDAVFLGEHMRKYHRTVTGYVQPLLARGFALEALVEPQPAREMLDAVPGMADELRRLDIPNVRVENGRVLFSGEIRDMAKANICLRTGERVLIVLADFPARTFEELFQGVYRTNLEDFIPKDGSFPVKGYCLNSQLMSVPDCQAIVKKAASRRLGEKYGVGWLPETGAKYQLQFSVMNDRAQLYLDTSGQGLHKRGYRAVGNDAPLRETLAAAMVQLTHYRGREFLWDPFCGSGTIPIEAALIARNAAPGGRRRFAAEAFAWNDGSIWDAVREEAKAKEFHGKYQILGSDNDPKCVSLAMANARKAGVGDILRFADGDATKMDLPAQSGILIGNPPYGQRMLEQQSAQRLYAALGRHLKYADGWKKIIITSDPEFEHYFGRRADKKRKLYNGMIKCDYYMYTDNSRKYQKRDDKK